MRWKNKGVNVRAVMYVCTYLIAGEIVGTSIFSITPGDNANIYIMYLQHVALKSRQH